jgi:hypothetical protein
MTKHVEPQPGFSLVCELSFDKGPRSKVQGPRFQPSPVVGEGLALPEVEEFTGAPLTDGPTINRGG